MSGFDFLDSMVVDHSKRACASCGFLGRRNIREGRLWEADDSFRADGMGDAREAAYLNDWPVCGANVQHLGLAAAKLINAVIAQSSAPASPNPEARRDSVKQVIAQGRDDCQSWTPWQVGLSPQEHRDLLDRRWMADREDARDREQRAFNAETAALQRRHEAFLAGRADAIQQDMSDAAKTAAKWQALGVVVAGLAFLAAILIPLLAPQRDEPTIVNNPIVVPMATQRVASVAAESASPTPPTP